MKDMNRIGTKKHTRSVRGCLSATRWSRARMTWELLALVVEPSTLPLDAADCFTIE